MINALWHETYGYHTVYITITLVTLDRYKY